MYSYCVIFHCLSECDRSCDGCTGIGADNCVKCRDKYFHDDTGCKGMSMRIISGQKCHWVFWLNLWFMAQVSL